MNKYKKLALILVVLGAITVPITWDITAFIFMLMVAIPLYFSKPEWFK